MVSFDNLKIRTKLNILIVFLALLLVGIGVTGLVGLHSANGALSTVYNDHLLAINELNEVRNHQLQMRINLGAAREETDAFEIMAINDNTRSHMFQIQNLLNAYTPRHQSAQEKKLLDEFLAARLVFGRDGVIPTMDLLQGEKFAEADKLRKDTLQPAYLKASKAIDDLIQFQVDSAKQMYDSVSANSKKIRIASIASIVVGLVLSVLLGFVITRSISRGVAVLGDAASKLANGDLTARAELDGKDELGELARAFNKMAQEFSALIAQVRTAADQVSQATATLSDTSEQVARVSGSQTEQAASAASAIEELNSAVKEIAQKADGVVSAANEASSASSHGQDVVNNAVRGIQQVAQTVGESAQLIASLGQRSDQIGQIIRVIKDIADQTNLLALNAAIEAARAGEQGRGFAVVADEVRKLAERTTGATSEISTMISAIQSETESAVGAMEKGSKQAGQGVELANQAVQSLQQINDSVSNVVDMIQQIAAATRSQSEASDVITTRVEHIAQMARDNGGSINQTTQASHGLQQLSLHLQQVISHFRM
jgi:methyl-accepting chemotaxis protein